MYCKREKNYVDLHVMHFKIIHEISLRIKFISVIFSFAYENLIYSNRNVRKEGGNSRLTGRKRLKLACWKIEVSDTQDVVKS